MFCFRILANVPLDLQAAALTSAAGLQGQGLESDQSPRPDKGTALTDWMLGKGLRGFSLWQFAVEISTLLWKCLKFLTQNLPSGTHLSCYGSIFVKLTGVETPLESAGNLKQLGWRAVSHTAHSYRALVLKFGNALYIDHVR